MALLGELSPAMVRQDSEEPSATEIMAIENWGKMSQKLLQESAIQSWLQIAKKLPEEIAALYDDVEFSSGIRFDADERQKYYDEFTHMTSGSDKLSLSDIEVLVRTKLGFNISRKALDALIQSKLKESTSGEYNRDGFGFEQFLSLVCELVQSPETRGKPALSTKPSLGLILRRTFPLDPESGIKMVWDMLCLLLLLYCSFSVPYSLAFDTDTPSSVTSQIPNLVIDGLFLLDMALNFATAYDLQVDPPISMA
jgi:hypothetical protein